MSRLAKLIGIAAIVASFGVMADNAGPGTPHVQALINSLMMAAGGLF